MESVTRCPNSITNYLDDYLIQSISSTKCNWIVHEFMRISHDIGLPMAAKKTEWATRQITFLELLLDGFQLRMMIPEDKRKKALDLVGIFLSKKKATVREIQVLAGTLNFLNKAIHPGRPFMRRMYTKYAHIADKGCQLKPHYHVRLDDEFRKDCKIWETFLLNQSAVCRPFIDIEDPEHTLFAEHIDFATDASRNGH